MKGVDHIDVVQIGGSGLVGQVDRVLQRQVPNGKRLELGIARLDAALVLMVELGQADRHFAAAGPGGGDDDERARGLYIIIFAEAVIGDDEGDILGIVGDYVVAVDADAEALQTLLELLRHGLTAKVRDDDTAEVQPYAAERVDEAQSVLIIGDAEIAAVLTALNIIGGDGDYDLRHVAHLKEHAHLAVGVEARQHA